jgi:toxin secretion/phage lysis holin
MKEFWTSIQLIFTALGGWLGYFLGGCDGMLIALIVFISVDYITGVMCGISEHNLSSEIGFKGISRKVFILFLVGVAHILDSVVFGHIGVLRNAVIFYYISNEGISIIENAAKLELPIPKQLVDVLRQIKESDEEK